ncbi:MAG: aminopeptidase P family protein [Enterocloster asparagiformis]|nr:aminopeptidase P family protein [Enterocloster asparagiformis]
MKAQLERFMERLPRSCDAAVIVGGANRRYLTGFSSSAGTLFITREAAYCIVDGRYIEAAEQTVRGCSILLEEDLDQQLRDLVERHGVKTVGIEADTLSLSRALRWQRTLLPARLLLDSGVDSCLKALRAVKSEEELKAICQAQSIADEAFYNMLNYVHPGAKELDLAIVLGEYAALHGCEKRSFGMIFTSGVKTSLPHGAPPDRCLEKGDLVMVDMGCMVNGYSSDMTRTFAVGEAGSRQREIYKIVQEAQERAVACIRPGALCREVDRAARDHIAEAGYGGYFGHNLGHSIGLEVHEDPRFSPQCETPLTAGNVISVEPGIYLPGRFGVRIEDLAVVTTKGCELISGVPRDLMIV